MELITDGICWRGRTESSKSKEHGAKSKGAQEHKSGLMRKQFIPFTLSPLLRIFVSVAFFAPRYNLFYLFVVRKIQMCG